MFLKKTSLKQPELGQLTRELRVLARLTQAQFAKELGVSASTIRRWEQNRAQPPAIVLRHIALLFERWLTQLCESPTRPVCDRAQALLWQFFSQSTAIAPEDAAKTKAQLLQEMTALRQENAELKAMQVKQQQTEQILRQQEQEFMALMENAPDVTARLDRDLHHTDVNSTTNLATGLLPDAFVLAVSRDITARRQAEAALKASEAHMRLALEAAHLFTWELDLATGMLINADQVRVALGLTFEPNSLSVEDWLEKLHPADRQRVPKEWHKTVMKKAEYDSQFRVVMADGTVRWLATRGKILSDASGRSQRAIGIGMDITQRKQAEEALRQSEDRFRKIFDESPIAISLASLEDYRIAKVNSAHQEIFGYSDADLAEMTFADFTHPDDVTANIHLVEQLRQGIISRFRLEKRFIRKNRTVMWANLTVTLLRDYEDRPCYSMAMIEDITERKQAEQALLTAQSRLEYLISSSPTVIYACEAHGSYTTTFISKNVIHQLGYRYQDWLSDAHFWIDRIHPEDISQVLTSLVPLFEVEQIVQEYRFLHKDGTYRWLRDEVKVIRDAKGEAVELVGSCTDITQRKRAEDRVKASLEEKSILLKEIHHRVKNNLQTISSLLRLQAAGVQDPKVLEPLKESQNRVRVMALIHEKLYQAPTLAKIDFPDYVEQLATEILRCYAAYPNKVALQVQVDPVDLSLDTAIPCGLIINELVSNALKYAFPEGRSGSVKIQFSPLDQDKFVLIIADDGIGLPKDLHPQTLSSLGLRLVYSLVKQIQGNVELRDESGTSFRIIFRDQK
jgi:PAS domain S-box-containing protein